MIWGSIAIFFVFLLVVGLMIMVTFYTINEFEKKMNGLISQLDSRYNLSQKLEKEIKEKIK